jgi:plasmid stabilization system protein ParE
MAGEAGMVGVGVADLDRFAGFLHDRHPGLAKIVAAEIRDRAQILIDHPRLGRPIADCPEFRELILDVLNAATSSLRDRRRTPGHASRLPRPRAARVTLRRPA